MKKNKKEGFTAQVIKKAVLGEIPWGGCGSPVLGLTFPSVSLKSPVPELVSVSVPWSIQSQPS